MYLKIIGLILLVGGSFMIALTLNRRLDRRIELTVGWSELILYIGDRIECFSMPIGEILAACDRELLLRCGFDGAESAEDVQGLLPVAQRADPEVYRILCEFASEFGRCYRQEQLQRCRSCHAKLLERRQTMTEQFRVKKRINLTMIMAGALMLAIIVF